MYKLICAAVVLAGMAVSSVGLAAEETWKDGVMFVEQKLAPVEGHTAVKIVFSLGNGVDVESVVPTLGLDADRRHYLTLLEVGQALVLVKGRFPRPVHVAFPPSEIRKGLVGDQDLLRRPE